MRELGTLRDGWETLEADETRLLRRLTIHESVQQWLALQRAFEAQLQETEALFGPERRAALAELQSRLRRLAEWQKEHGESITIPADASAASE
ncbi:MAG TPA: hypothetical protein PLH19_06805 [Anaerolineae bacterium]|nr:hypothetical protein [Anaerolineae bacterium]HQH38231.1 hypothetical protein [Anaerolineae bacterium]